MAKSNSKSLRKLQSKKIVFNGRFEDGERDLATILVKLQSGSVANKLGPSTNYLVVPDLSDCPTAQRTASSLNRNGAAIQVVNLPDFMDLVALSDRDIADVIRRGRSGVAMLKRIFELENEELLAEGEPMRNLTSEDFSGLDLSGLSFSSIGFYQCSFAGAKLSKTEFSSAEYCDFSKSTGTSPKLSNIQHSRFIRATFKSPKFKSLFDGCDFSKSRMEQATFSEEGTPPASPAKNVNFSDAYLPKAEFTLANWTAADFRRANLRAAKLQLCKLPIANFEKADLSGTVLTGCNFDGANFAKANLSEADLRQANLRNACVTAAEFRGSQLFGTTLTGVNLSSATHVDLPMNQAGAIGPALAELDIVAKSARQIAISFHVRSKNGRTSAPVKIESRHLNYSWYRPQLPFEISLVPVTGLRRQSIAFSDLMLSIANALQGCKVRYESLVIKSSKAGKTRSELREVVTNAICEAFAQTIASPDEIKDAARQFRKEMWDAGSDSRKRKANFERRVRRLKIKQRKESTAAIKQLGQIANVPIFLKALELRADKSKIDKATKMLKAEKFQLFNDITDAHLNGVVKSQTDADLVYACRIQPDGQYACCTQNLNVCGGLRGSICKHLLVLIIGLVKAGQLDPANIDAWIAKSHDVKSELDKETMGEIFIRYKGAEAGEVDWRPTETVPEDYYAV